MRPRTFVSGEMTTREAAKALLTIKSVNRPWSPPWKARAASCDSGEREGSRGAFHPYPRDG